jgi:hypothetical protein
MANQIKMNCALSKLSLNRGITISEIVGKAFLLWAMFESKSARNSQVPRTKAKALHKNALLNSPLFNFLRPSLSRQIARRMMTPRNIKNIANKVSCRFAK